MAACCGCADPPMQEIEDMYRATRHELHYPVEPLHEDNNLGIVKEDAASSHHGGSVGWGNSGT